MSKEEIVERIENKKYNSVDPEAYLSEAGAIESVDTEVQLAFTTEFEELLQAEIDRYRDAGVSEGDVARMFSVEESKVTEKDRPYTAYKVIYTVYKWPSHGALIYDAATDAAMRDLTDDWEEVPAKQRYKILESLRSFQNTCLFCDGTIIRSDEVVESCCDEREVITLHCGGCDRRFLEFTVDTGNGDANMRRRG
jgi:hypothetical protein